MSADILRQAANLMRERAAVVNYPSPWSVGGGGGTCAIRCNDGRNYVASTYGGVGTEEAAAEHIATWHPAVALAVADLLEHTAVADEKHREALGRGIASGRMDYALALATTYLGSES